MIKPRKVEMIYKELKDIAHYYMFIAACISEQEKEELEKEWGKQGGYKKNKMVGICNEKY